MNVNYFPSIIEFIPVNIFLQVFNGFDTVWVNEDDLRINDPDLCSFQNLNTPHDYEQALAQVRT